MAVRRLKRDMLAGEEERLLQRHTPEVAAGGDEQSFAIGSAKGAVAALVG